MPALNTRDCRKQVELIDWYTEYDADIEEHAKKKLHSTEEPEYLDWD